MLAHFFFSRLLTSVCPAVLSFNLVPLLLALTYSQAWDLTMQHCVQTVVGHRSEVWSIAVRYGTDGLNRLVTGSSDNQVR